jgi:uncharacterized protein YndB with AHSA1/START domain
MNLPDNPVEKVAAQPFVITREFAAPRELVWKAWTEPERLQQWFGPKGFTGTMMKLDLRPGGTLLSCLRSLDGKEMWGKWIFREVRPQELLVWVHSFSDKDGGITRHPLNPTWPLELLTETTFAGLGGKTVVTLKWTPLNATDEEIKTFNNAHQGMTQGWGGTFDQLAEYLKQQPTKEKK